MLREICPLVVDCCSVAAAMLSMALTTVDGTDGVLHVADHLIEGAARLIGQVAHLIGHHGEALAVLARPRRFDGSVECKQVRLVRDLVDRRHDLPDPLTGPWR